MSRKEGLTAAKGHETCGQTFRPRRPSAMSGRPGERGMTTIEYALGILSAAAIALTLLRIVNDPTFFQAMRDWVMGLIGSLTKG